MTDLSTTFTTCSASIIGTQHLRELKPNQDGVCVVQAPGHIVGVVADGCSGGALSEVGAKLFATVAARELAYAATPKSPFPLQNKIPDLWLHARTSILRIIGAVLVGLGHSSYNGELYGDIRKIREDANAMLLFTLVAFVITPERTEVAAIGDGYAAANGELLPIERASDNLPTYLTYAHMKSGLAPERLQWKLLKSLPTDELQSLVIGSDGLGDLDAVAAEPMPNLASVDVPAGFIDVPAGPVSQFVTEPRYAKNKDAARRRLVQIQGGLGPAGLKPGGLLPDDTTLIAVKRTATTKET